jgi:cytochrome c biogenesis protein ResB
MFYHHNKMYQSYKDLYIKEICFSIYIYIYVFLVVSISICLFRKSNEFVEDIIFCFVEI